MPTLQEGLIQKDGIWYRDCRGDRLAVRDTAAMFRKGAVVPGDVCLDLGAHIGAFTVRALAAGAVRVVAVEPMPGNLELFALNVGEDPQVVLLPGAVTEDMIGRAQSNWKEPP
jgi:predicted RNA methylase